MLKITRISLLMHCLFLQIKSQVGNRNGWGQTIGGHVFYDPLPLTEIFLFNSVFVFCKVYAYFQLTLLFKSQRFLSYEDSYLRQILNHLYLVLCASIVKTIYDTFL